MKKKKNLQKGKNDNTNHHPINEHHSNEPKNDTSPIVYQRTKLKHELSIFERELTEKQKEFINIALNKDALKEALQFCEQLINEGKEVYLVDLDGKDPSELGFRHFTELIQNTYPLTFSGLLEKKLYLL